MEDNWARAKSGCAIVSENIDEGCRHQAGRKSKVKESFGPKRKWNCMLRNFLCINKVWQLQPVQSPAKVFIRVTQYFIISRGAAI
jgi:hypothetical protein